MHRYLILLLIFGMVMAGCRTQEMTAVDYTRAAEELPAPVPEPAPDTLPEPSSIRVVEEHFSFGNLEDERSHEENRFFVILGSFLEKDNATRFMTTLREQGFSPVVLVSETGFHRVSVDSFNLEGEARERIQQVRGDYPGYNDAWLLIRAL